VIASYKRSSLFGLIVSDKEKSFIKMTPGVSLTELVFFVTDNKSKKARVFVFSTLHFLELNWPNEQVYFSFP